MLPSDKADFSILMTNCFQNYRASVSKPIIDEWFEEMKGFNFFNVQEAFRDYTNNYERFPPTRAAIIKRCKIKAASDNQKKIIQRCYVIGCSLDADVIRGERECFCRDHDDEYILKIFPKSLEADLIRRARRIEAESKAFGMTGKEYFEKTIKRFKSD